MSKEGIFVFSIPKIVIRFRILEEKKRYFLRVFAILSAGLSLLFLSCIQEGSDQRPRVVKNTVYAIPFPEEKVYNPGPTQIPDTSYLNFLFLSKGLVDIHELDSSIQVNLRYADTNNFLHSSFYDGLKTAYLTCEAAIKLSNAQHYLRAVYPEYSLVVFDAARPLHIQQLMWDSLKMPGPKKYQYLSIPSEPSLHNYGCAVDVSILDLNSKRLLDMGSEFDHFGKLSEPMMEKELLKKGGLSEEAYKNRLLLRKVMLAAKFKPITTEWWHFSICTKPEAQQRFDLIY
jgi:zinc D-Ala-D-Ala dipeptidase